MDIAALLGLWGLLVYILPGAFFAIALRATFGKSLTSSVGISEDNTWRPAQAAAAGVLAGILLHQMWLATTETLGLEKPIRDNYAAVNADVAGRLEYQQGYRGNDKVAPASYLIARIRKDFPAANQLLIQARGEAEFCGSVVVASLTIAVFAVVALLASFWSYGYSPGRDGVKIARKQYAAAAVILGLVAYLSLCTWHSKMDWFHRTIAPHAAALIDMKE